jgi:hypothetical protein
MRQYFITCIVGTVFLLTACERERVLPLLDAPDKLVLHAIYDPDSTFSLTINSATNLATNSNQVSVPSNAIFTFWLNDEKYYTSEAELNENGKYVFPFITPKAGDNLKVLIEVEGYPVLQSQITIPDKPLSSLQSLFINENTLNPRVFVTMQLDWDAEKLGPYIIYSTGAVHDQQSGMIQNRRFKVMSSDDRIDTRAGDQDEIPQALIFFPETKPGDNTNYLNLTITGIPSSFKPGHPKQRVNLIVEKLTPDLYKYYLSLHRSQNAQSSIAYGQPFSIHTNVENGIGVVGASVKTTVPIYW